MVTVVSVELKVNRVNRKAFPCAHTHVVFSTHAHTNTHARAHTHKHTHTLGHTLGHTLTPCSAESIPRSTTTHNLSLSPHGCGSVCSCRPVIRSRQHCTRTRALILRVVTAGTNFTTYREEGRLDCVEVRLCKFGALVHVVHALPAIALAQVVACFARAHDLDPRLLCPRLHRIEVRERVILRHH